MRHGITTVVSLTAWSLLPITGLACNASERESASPAASASSSTDEKQVAEGGGRFDKSIRKDPCALLTPKMVSDALGVPEAELKQQKMMGCIYSWNSADDELRAALTTIFVHKTPKAAADWFQNATKDKTEEELRAEMEEVKRRTAEKLAERAKEKGREVSDVEKSAANTIGDLVLESAAADGIRYGAVAGLGDEARVNLNDGVITVRVDNLVFNISAYRGKKAPDVALDPKGGMAALKELAAKSQAAQREWVTSTLDARREAATKIATAVVKAL